MVSSPSQVGLRVNGKYMVRVTDATTTFQNDIVVEGVAVLEKLNDLEARLKTVEDEAVMNKGEVNISNRETGELLYVAGDKSMHAGQEHTSSWTGNARTRFFIYRR